MRKMFLFLMMLTVLVSTLGVQTTKARADGLITYEGGEFVVGVGILFTFDASSYRNKDLKNATIYVGSDFYDLNCWVRKEDGEILCSVRGGLTQFAGQTAIIYLAGQIFYVTIPRPGGPNDDSSLSCTDGLVSGADVMVDFGSGPDGPYFVPGNTLAEVQSLAESWFSGATSIDIVSGLYCSAEPT